MPKKADKAKEVVIPEIVGPAGPGKTLLRELLIDLAKEAGSVIVQRLLDRKARTKKEEDGSVLNAVKLDADKVATVYEGDRLRCLISRRKGNIVIRFPDAVQVSVVDKNHDADEKDDIESLVIKTGARRKNRAGDEGKSRVS